MRNERVVATCGCICEVSAEYDWVDGRICDVEVNIVEIICDYHSRPTPLAPDRFQREPADVIPLQSSMFAEVPPATTSGR